MVQLICWEAKNDGYCLRLLQLSENRETCVALSYMKRYYEVLLRNKCALYIEKLMMSFSSFQLFIETVSKVQ